MRHRILAFYIYSCVVIKTNKRNKLQYSPNLFIVAVNHARLCPFVPVSRASFVSFMCPFEFMCILVCPCEALCVLLYLCLCFFLSCLCILCVSFYVFFYYYSFSMDPFVSICTLFRSLVYFFNLIFVSSFVSLYVCLSYIVSKSSYFSVLIGCLCLFAFIFFFPFPCVYFLVCLHHPPLSVFLYVCIVSLCVYVSLFVFLPGPVSSRGPRCACVSLRVAWPLSCHRPEKCVRKWRASWL